MLTRRGLLRAGGLTLAGVVVARRSRGARVVEIRMKSDPDGAEVWFDPVGVYLEPGQIVRWIVEANVHTTAAYHPKNDSHSLRIPEAARPWDSGFLVNPGDRFEVTLTVPGVYDYYCQPHEAAGMVGRIVVGSGVGPGAMPFDYFRGQPGTEHWRPVPEAARKTFPSVAAIMRERIVMRSRGAS